MKANKIVAAALIAAMFIVLPVTTAEVSDAKSWDAGDTTAYYTATGINDKEVFENLLNPTNLSTTTFWSMFGNINEDSTVLTEVSNLTLERGNGEKVADSRCEIESYQLINGTMKFTSTIKSDGKFRDETLPGYMTGDAYEKLNEYFGDLTAGTEVNYIIKAELLDVAKNTADYKEISTTYVITAMKEARMYMVSSDLEITIGEKTAIYHANQKVKGIMDRTYRFEEDLTTESALPAKELGTIHYITEVPYCDTYVEIEGNKHVIDCDLAKMEEAIKGDQEDIIDREYTYIAENDDISISPTNYTKIVDGFQSDADAALQYLNEKGITHTETYSDLDKVVMDALYGQPSSDSDNNTVLIVVGSVAGVAVVGAVAFFIFKKK